MIRLDELVPGGASWSFDRPTATGRAEHLDEVRSSIGAAEARTAGGEWVVLVVAYEAAAAFDEAMRTAPAPPDGVPLVWWQSFAKRTREDPLVASPTCITSRRRRANRHDYPTAVELVRERIGRGDAYQVNITDRFEGRYEGAPFDVYRGLVSVQSCRFGAYVELDDVVIASASPELFFRWEEDRITCRPMKGTAGRQPRPDADARAGLALQRSEKDRAENVMIVDLLRNDLGGIARTGSVHVPELFSLERYETVWQLTSTVVATPLDGVGLLDVFGALFPCGSVTGAPKISAMSIIAEIEADARGVYCGAIGLLAPAGHEPRAVCSVPIRTAVLRPSGVLGGTYEYGAGAGITWSSDPAAEDEEVRAKARILTRSHRELSLIETLRLDSDGVANAAAHLDRMAASAEWFGFPFEREAAAARLHDLRPFPEVDVERIRVLLRRDGTITVERHPLDHGPEPVRLAVDTVVTRSDDPFSCHKTTWRRHYEEARRRHPDCDDVILVNEHGHLVETTVANLAVLIDGQWWCPPLTDGGLPGIARQQGLADGRLRERSLVSDDLVDRDIAVINDLRGWRSGVLIS